MEFGVSLLGLDLDAAIRTARDAEELGFESVWLSDHVVVPEHSDSRVPEHGPVPPDLPLYDAAATMAHLGAVTSRLRIGTWVYVLPLRHPFVTARAFLTADVLTGGRIDIGIGVGYLEAEFDAVGVDFATRGRRTDEALEACRLLWSEPRPEYHGAHFDFSAVGFGPRPVQTPPPLWIGGESAAAMRRAARFGVGWIGTEHTPESLEPQLRALHSAEAAQGRDAPLRVTVGAGSVTGRKDAPDLDRAQVEQFRAMGVDRLIVRPWRSRRDVRGSLERFAAERFS